MKNHKEFSKYWCETPKTWKPTFTYFWNVILFIFKPLPFDYLPFLILGDEHPQYVEHPEIPGGTHQEEAATGDVRSTRLHRHSEGV